MARGTLTYITISDAPVVAASSMLAICATTTDDRELTELALRLAAVWREETESCPDTV